MMLCTAGKAAGKAGDTKAGAGDKGGASSGACTHVQLSRTAYDRMCFERNIALRTYKIPEGRQATSLHWQEMSEIREVCGFGGLGLPKSSSAAVVCVWCFGRVACWVIGTLCRRLL